MPWTASARRQYARTATRYTTDLSDAEFALIVPHLPSPSRLGRPRTVDLRQVLNAILYLLRSGCPWDLLPKELPAKSTVFGYFRRWWEDGTWPTLHAKLVMAAREQAGKEACPSAGWSRGRLPGSAAIEGWPRTSRQPSPPPQPWCTSPQSSSSCGVSQELDQERSILERALRPLAEDRVRWL